MSTTQLHAERAHKCCWRPSERITECTWSCLGVSFRVLQTKEPFFTKLSSLTHTYACNTFVLNMLGRRDMQACHTYTPDIDRDSHTRGFAGPAAHQRAHLDAYDQRLPGGITQRAAARPRQPAHGRPSCVRPCRRSRSLLHLAHLARASLPLLLTSGRAAKEANC